MPEQTGTSDAGNPADKRKVAPARRLRDSSPRVTPIGRGVVLRAAAILVVFIMMQSLPVESGIHEHIARAAASQGPFSTPIVVNDNKANEQVLPVVAAMPNGGLFVAWQDWRSGNEDIYSSTSFNNGSSFSANKRVDDSVGTSKQLKPAVAVSGNGTVFVVWQDNRRVSVDYDIYLSRSFNSGATFTKNMKVDDSNGAISWQERPSIAVTRGGIVCVAWTDDRTGILRVRESYSSDGGATFSASQEIAPGSGPSGQTGVGLASSGNRLFAAFMDNVTGKPHPYICTSSNGGKSFSAPTRLDGLGDAAISQRSVAITPMPGGGVVAAWEDSRNGNWDIYASIVSPRGTISMQDIKVDDDAMGYPQIAPRVASDQLGNIYAAWTDSRDGSSSAVRFACLESGNTTFNSSMIISEPGGFDFQMGPSIISIAPGRVFVSWYDDKANTYDVYMSGAFFPGLFGISLSSGWNLISIPSIGYSYTANTLGLRPGDVVSSWNSSTQAYGRTFIVGITPPSADFPLTPGVGYWVLTTVHERLNLKGNIPTGKQSRLLDVPSGGGWVIMGFESLNTSRLASDIPKMTNIPGSIDVITTFDPGLGSYLTYIVGVPPSDFALTPGQACWYHCKTSVTLEYVS